MTLQIGKIVGVNLKAVMAIDLSARKQHNSISYIEHVPIWHNNFTEKYAVICHSSYVKCLSIGVPGIIIVRCAGYSTLF